MNAAVDLDRARSTGRGPFVKDRGWGSLLALCVWYLPASAWGQAIPSLSADAMPGLARVPTALVAPRFSAVGSAGYGHTGAVLDDTDAHHRLGMSLAASYSPLDTFVASARVSGRYDAHKGPASSGSNGFATAGELRARARFQPTGALHLGFEARGLLPPADDATRSLQSFTPEVSSFGTLDLSEGLLTSLVGVRLNRSDRAFPADTPLSPYEQLALGASDDPQLLLGLGGGWRFGRTLAFADVRYELAIGNGAPAARYAPLVASAGARAALGRLLELGGQMSVSMNPYPAPEDVGEIPVTPRLWLQLTLAVRFDPEDSAATQTRAPAPPEDTQPPSALHSFVGRVTGPHGIPLEGAEVQLTGPGEARSVELSKDGRLLVDDLRAGEWQLEVTAEGYGPVRRSIRIPYPGELRVTLERALPPGQIQVRVQDFRGRRVDAKVVLQDDGRRFESHAGKGTYVLDMPPGKYTVEVFAEGYATERRSVVVEENGVTIVVIDVRKERTP